MNKNNIGSLAWVTVVLITTITQTNTQNNSTFDDPCNNYTALDNPWRATNTTIQLDICDRPFNWTGWYRMLYYGMNIRMPQSCVNEYRCGTDITLWLNDPHPQIVDGIVTRRVCGRSGTDCCASVSTPIRVKACPGNYYVYEFVKTTCSAAYCADVNTITPNIAPTTATVTSVSTDYAVFDPCSVYNVLDDEWRIMDGLVYTIYRGHDDTVAKWNGWYRLYLQGKNAQIPEPDWCANYIVCGGYTPLFLGGSHPQTQDGIVTREIYGSYGYVTDGRQCNSYRSNSIQVKACPGQFYVYRLVQPAVLFPRPTYCTVALDTPSYDPCNSYTSLDQPWRGTNATGGTNCDRSFNGDGWYRLLYKGMNIRMPESCVALSKCDVTTIMPISTTTRSSTKLTTSSDLYMTNMSTAMSITTTTLDDSSQLNRTNPNITVSEECKDNFTTNCADSLFSQIENITVQVLSPDVVIKYIDMVLNAQEQLLKVEILSLDILASYGNTVLNRTEKLLSTLVKPTETTDSVNISLNGLDVQVFAAGPKASLKEILQLSINSAQMDIDLMQILMNNNGSAAVAFMSFTNMSSMLKPSLFKTSTNTVNNMVSNVMSATLPKTTNTQLPTPVNFTLKHTAEIDPNSVLSCVYWNNTEWAVDVCSLLQTNSSHSVCSCVHLSTFALIMQTNPPKGDDSDPLLELLNTLAVAVGLVFLSLALLTFALCRQHLRVNAAPLINLCISLFLAHLLFLLTQELLQYILMIQLACAVLAGVLHFLFLSAFVWMFIEAVLLFLSVKNLTNIRSKQNKMLNWKYLTVIGYVIPLTVVGVSAGLVPDGYGSEQCWIKTDRNFVWSFLGPVCLILTLNLILFIIIIIITLRNTLAGLNTEHSKIKEIKTLVFKTLIVILGCPWILGFFVNGSKVLEIIFLFLNSQQGTFIFLVHCVFNHEVRQQYWKWLTTFCPHFKPPTTTDDQNRGKEARCLQSL
ncbi:adhesion G protein-coupled receptor L4-like [Colossoma macropomum]|uniref:adhesion G protein-coupled receptor L4-like n=1 Tax=Colossoma macropomum TaxID=42526 RepID=UPI001864431D|nr:adhesion G protein-coupled receptor L4-like [Colossoma macropomum]